MAYLLSRLIIFFAWIVKWVVIKSRLLMPTLFISVGLIFFEEWYRTNEMVANGILTALVAVVAVSWIITLINKLKYLKRQHKCDVAYAYKIAGEPIVGTKKANKNCKPEYTLYNKSSSIELLLCLETICVLNKVLAEREGFAPLPLGAITPGFAPFSATGGGSNPLEFSNHSQNKKAPTKGAFNIFWRGKGINCETLKTR